MEDKFDYDVLTIGMGPAGMAVSAMAAELGLRVCGVEGRKIGGECMNVGCIPSKALLRIAKARHAITKFSKYGLAELALPAVSNPFPRIQVDLDYISEQKNLRMFEKVDLVLGKGYAKFVDPHTVQVGDKKISARKIFIATGTKPSLPAIPGLSEIEPLTNENVFSLEKVPDSLVVLGAGAIACELTQAFARLGTKVTIVYRGKQILRSEDSAAATLLESQFNIEGIEIHYNANPKLFSKITGGISVELDTGVTLKAEKVLVALGRTMNFSSLGLENAGIRYSETGITVNKYLQTNQPHIYAVGDCNGYYKFSHAAMHQGMIALINSMLPGILKKDFRKFVVPLTIFTEPQISRVGMTEKELLDKRVSYDVVQSNYADYGAAIAEKIDTGFVKTFVSKTGKIYGAVVVGEGSGDMINEWGLAIQNKMRMHKILFLQHSFPTMAFLNKRVSEIWVTKLIARFSLIRSLAKSMFRRSI